MIRMVKLRKQRPMECAFGQYLNSLHIYVKVLFVNVMIFKQKFDSSSDYFSQKYDFVLLKLIKTN